MPPCNCLIDPYDFFTILIGPILFLFLFQVSTRMGNPLITWAYWARLFPFLERYLTLDGWLAALAGGAWGKYRGLFPAFVPFSVVFQLALYVFGVFLAVLIPLTTGTGFLKFVDRMIVSLGLGAFSGLLMTIALSFFAVLLLFQLVGAARWFMGLIVLGVIAVYFWGTLVGVEEAALGRISNAGLSGVLCCFWLAVVDIWKWIWSFWR